MQFCRRCAGLFWWKKSFSINWLICIPTQTNKYIQYKYKKWASSKGWLAFSVAPPRPNVPGHVVRASDQEDWEDDGPIISVCLHWGNFGISPEELDNIVMISQGPYP